MKYLHANDHYDCARAGVMTVSLRPIPPSHRKYPIASELPLSRHNAEKRLLKPPANFMGLCPSERA
jgi:hypothetical protein